MNNLMLCLLMAGLLSFAPKSAVLFEGESITPRGTSLLILSVGRPTLFQTVTEWGTPWLPASEKREEQRRGEV